MRSMMINSNRNKLYNNVQSVLNLTFVCLFVWHVYCVVLEHNFKHEHEILVVGRKLIDNAFSFYLV